MLSPNLTPTPTKPTQQIDALNRERKVQQMAAGGELRRLEDEWANAVRKNLEISLACEKLEAEVRMLRAQLPEDQQQQQVDGGGEQQQRQDGNGSMNGQHAVPMDE